ncbi:hypothetical protein GOODEAATRI_021099 [Goodea atripinnis]|uniref:Uncharacterized protein n=1 Tax=Goodea atripinnis TaxID=208336 RepID=A0ABV0MJU2_9TELE
MPSSFTRCLYIVLLQMNFLCMDTPSPAQILDELQRLNFNLILAMILEDNFWMNMYQLHSCIGLVENAYGCRIQSHDSWVPMRVLKTSTIFEKKWLATQVDAAAACPVQEGSVFFTQNTITWYLPRQIDPMISSGQFNLLEVHFGINGQRLGAVEMQAREYSVALNDFYIVTELPIGGVGGYYKSHIQDDLYYVSYMIEPMLELLWTEDATYEQTRYKVFFHIATHLLPQPLELIDMFEALTSWSIFAIDIKCQAWHYF